jgi:5'-phosphate synthase pdxT subunit
VGLIYREGAWMSVRIGVLALQGSVREHCNSIKACGGDPVEIRYREEFDTVEGLIIPGGESTTVGKLLVRNNMLDILIEKGRNGFPIFGTCTGMILLAKDIIGSEQPRLSLMDIEVERNAFGRQVDSFEKDMLVEEIGPPAFHAIFIRAPYITRVGEGVKILAEQDGKILLARQGNLMAAAFHPELTDDIRIHQYFCNLCR